MYDHVASYAIREGAAFLGNNLSVYVPSPKADAFAAFVGRMSIHVIAWNANFEQLRHDYYELLKPNAKTDAVVSAAAAEVVAAASKAERVEGSSQTSSTVDAADTAVTAVELLTAAAAERLTVTVDTPVAAISANYEQKLNSPRPFPITQTKLTITGIVMQARICKPIYRSEPVLVILTTLSVLVIDVLKREVIFSAPISKLKYSATISGRRTQVTTCGFARGIECVENVILVGANTGEIHHITCTNETKFQLKNGVKKEHDSPITDIAMCIFDGITASADVGGNIVVWSRQLKSATKKISTCQPISVLNILRRQVLCGTHNGQILLYSYETGELMAEVNAHNRQITSLSVAPESAYVLTVSEDSNLRMWKLHTRNPQCYKIEYRYCEKFDNRSLVGGAFSSLRGNCFAVVAYEGSDLLIYKVNRGRPPNNNAEKAGPTDAALVAENSPATANGSAQRR